MKTLRWPSGERTVSDALASEVLSGNELAAWLAKEVDGITLQDLPREKRLQMSAPCFHVSIEHHHAIVDLIGRGLYGSATALQRSAVEAYFRGVWLFTLANDSQLDAVGRDERSAFPGFSQLVAAIDSTLPNGSVGIPTSVLGSWWGQMCSYAHTGYQQIGARLSEQGLASAYADAELELALSVSGLAAVLSSGTLASLAKRDDLAAQIAVRLDRFGD